MTTSLKLLRNGNDPAGPGQGLVALTGALNPAERESVAAALALAEPIYAAATLKTGEPALDHALGAAGIVSELRLGGDAIAAALLAPLAGSHPARLAEIKARCGPAVADLV